MNEISSNKSHSDQMIEIMNNSRVELKEHIDGKWYTSEHIILEHYCQIKMQPGKGSKIHIWNQDKTKVLKTFRYSFATQEYLIKKAEGYIKNSINK